MYLFRFIVLYLFIVFARALVTITVDTNVAKTKNGLCSVYIGKFVT